MKKLFTLISVACMVLNAQAFKETWQSAEGETSPVTLQNITITFNNDNNGTWSFGKNYAAGSENGQSVTIAPTASGELTIYFGGAIGTNKKLHMQDADAKGLTAKLVSNKEVTIEDNASPAAEIASGDGIIYALEAGQTYTFSVSGTKWRFASLLFTDEKEVTYTTEWNFSEWEKVSGFTNQVKDNLGFLASYKDAESAITNFAAIADSNKNPYTKCLKMGGNGAALEGTGTPTQRFLYFNVNGNADIYVHCVAGGDGTRNLVISDGKTELTRSVTAKTLTEVKYSYTGPAGIICLYSDGGAVNIYDIKANNVGTTVMLDDTTKPTPTDIQTIKNVNLEKNPAYNLAGQKVVNDYKGLVIKNGKKIVVK